MQATTESDTLIVIIEAGTAWAHHLETFAEGVQNAIVLVQQSGESSLDFAARTRRRLGIAAADQLRIKHAVICCNNDGSEATVAGRCLIARNILRAMDDAGHLMLSLHDPTSRVAYQSVRDVRHMLLDDLCGTRRSVSIGAPQMPAPSPSPRPAAASEARAA